MSLLTPYINNLRSIEQDIPKIAKKAIRANVEEIENLLKQTQLGKGKNSDGLPLAWRQGKKSGNGRYAPTTQKFANLGIPSKPIRPKIPGQPYNFEWDGSTFRMMGVKLKGNEEYEIFTRTGKQKFLESIYGRIFDLTEKNNDLVNEKIVLPFIQDFIFENLLNV